MLNVYSQYVAVPPPPPRGSALKRSASEPGVTAHDYREVLLGLSRISKFAGLIIAPVWLFCCHCK